VAPSDEGEDGLARAGLGGLGGAGREGFGGGNGGREPAVVDEAGQGGVPAEESVLVVGVEVPAGGGYASGR
jgi:hypothetical protein